MKKVWFLVVLFIICAGLTESVTVTEVVKGQAVSVKVDLEKCWITVGQGFDKAYYFSCQDELERGMIEFGEKYSGNYNIEEIGFIIGGGLMLGQGIPYTVGAMVRIKLKPANERPAPAKPEADPKFKK